MSERMTKKRLAEEVFHVTEKTARELRKYTAALEHIRETLDDDDLYNRFVDLVQKSQHDKQRGISMSMIRELSRYNREDMTFIVTECVNDPAAVRNVFSTWLNDTPVKITVTLPSYVNDYWKEKAAAKGISKTKYIEGLLTYLAVDEEEDE